MDFTLIVMDRKTFIKASGMLALGGVAANLQSCQSGEPKTDGWKDELWKDVKPTTEADFPIHDLHIHASQAQTYRDIAEKAKERHFAYYGIMFNGTRPTPATDETLQKFLDDTAPLGCYRGMQNMKMGWTANLSEDIYKQIDYFFMDPQMIPNGNCYGDTLEVWEHDCYVPDLDDFMEVNMKHYRAVLENPEPLDVFGWPLYLPPCIARHYNEVWTRERLESVVDMMVKRKVAVEINDFAQTPHEEFILMCKKAGLKFVFGSDSRDYRCFRLDFCKRIACRCGLTESDFWKPERKQNV